MPALGMQAYVVGWLRMCGGCHVRYVRLWLMGRARPHRRLPRIGFPFSRKSRQPYNFITLKWCFARGVLLLSKAIFTSKPLGNV